MGPSPGAPEEIARISDSKNRGFSNWYRKPHSIGAGRNRLGMRKQPRRCLLVELSRPHFSEWKKRIPGISSPSPTSYKGGGYYRTHHSRSQSALLMIGRGFVSLIIMSKLGPQQHCYWIEPGSLVTPLLLMLLLIPPITSERER